MDIGWKMSLIKKIENDVTMVKQKQTKETNRSHILMFEQGVSRKWCGIVTHFSL